MECRMNSMKETKQAYSVRFLIKSLRKANEGYIDVAVSNDLFELSEFACALSEVKIETENLIQVLAATTLPLDGKAADAADWIKKIRNNIECFRDDLQDFYATCDSLRGLFFDDDLLIDEASNLAQRAQDLRKKISRKLEVLAGHKIRESVGLNK
jgi:hypothetical protein